MVDDHQPSEPSSGEPRTRTAAECPSCGRFVGPYERCPYCGADVGQRMAVRVFKYGSLVLAVVGVVSLMFNVQGRKSKVEYRMLQTVKCPVINGYSHVRLWTVCQRWTLDVGRSTFDDLSFEGHPVPVAAFPIRS